MKHHISDLIDLRQLESLMQSLHRASGLPYALLDAQSNVLIAVGWQRICTEFHRRNPETAAQCTRSDQYILDHLQRGKYVGYTCPQGLRDYATPLIIEGQHLGTIFTGQVFNEPPAAEFFDRQAENHGFDKASYLGALQEVSVVSEERIEAAMAFLVDLAQMLASNGLNRLRQMQAEEGLLSAKQALEAEVQDRKEAESAARAYAERLQLMTKRMAELQEAEQQRLARELHDSVSSNLSLIAVQLTGIGEELPASLEPAAARIADCTALVEDCLQATRDVGFDLHPAVLDYMGLAAALEDLGAKFSMRTGMAVSVAASGCVSRLPARKEIVVFRIAQEALVNCVKHSQATSASIHLACDPNGVQLAVCDNGVGFSMERLTQPNHHTGLGLLSMQERIAAIGGRCRIDSLPGKGTKVIVEVAL